MFCFSLSQIHFHNLSHTHTQTQIWAYIAFGAKYSYHLLSDLFSHHRPQHLQRIYTMIVTHQCMCLGGLHLWKYFSLFTQCYFYLDSIVMLYMCVWVVVYIFTYVCVHIFMCIYIYIYIYEPINQHEQDETQGQFLKKV